MNRIFCYVGNWGKNGKSTGYGIFTLDPEKGSLTWKENCFPGLSVGASCVDQERGILYCADEKSDYPGMRHGGGGEVHAFHIRPDGSLEKRNSMPTMAPLTSFVAMDTTRNYLVATNHGSRQYVTQSYKDENGKFRVSVLHDDGTVVLYRLMPDGSIGEILDIFYMQGTGPKAVQFMAHPHSVRFAPDGKFMLVCDKGGDGVYTFQIQKDRLVPCGKPFRAMPGSAPRYSAFHPTKPFVYTNNELKTTISCFQYDSSGALTEIACVPGIPGESVVDDTAMQSDLTISPDGKHLYSLVRGRDLVAVFDIDQQTGALTPVQTYAAPGKNLRGCALSPDGRFLLLAALDSHQVLSCKLDENGCVSGVVCQVEQSTPCCVTFYTGL